MVFQNYALFPHLTRGPERGLPAHGAQGAEGRAAAPRRSARSRWCGCAAWTTGCPAQLSGGQQQRVALARALVFEPQLVLMDEPLGALDKQLREHMQIELKELHRQLGVTFVYVTHDQGEALTMSDRVAVFNDGVIQQIDAVEQHVRGAGQPFRRRLRRRQHGAQGRACAADRQRALRHRAARRPRADRPERQRRGRGRRRSRPASAPSASCCTRRRRSEPGNVLQAEVARVIYFGDHLRLLCAIGGGQADATVKLPLTACSAPHRRKRRRGVARVPGRLTSHLRGLSAFASLLSATANPQGVVHP